MHVVIKLIIRSMFNLPPPPEFIGWNGERLTSKVLKKLDRNGFRGKALRNVYVPEGYGRFAEIDLLYVARKGIFVLESKNYSGFIYGSENDQTWTQVLAKGKKESFYNPVKQNATHVQSLARFLNVPIPLFSIVVFSERCQLKKVDVSPNAPAVVLKRDKLYAKIVEIWRNAPDALSPAQVEAVAEMLAPLANVDEQQKKAHVERIKSQARR